MILRTPAIPHIRSRAGLNGYKILHVCKVIAFCYASAYLGTRIIVALISQTWRIDECTIFVLAQKPSGSIAERNTVSPALRIKHYSYSIEKTYIHWAKRYIPFHNKHHPEAVFFTAEMGAPEIEAFLTHLAQAENVAASTQNQTFNALLFLYRNALHFELNVPIRALCAKRAKHLPTVLSKAKLLASWPACRDYTN